MLEPSILGRHNRREPRNRLEFPILLTVHRPGDQMKAQLALGMTLDWRCWPKLPATVADKSATILTQTLSAELQSLCMSECLLAKTHRGELIHED